MVSDMDVLGEENKTNPNPKISLFFQAKSRKVNPINELNAGQQNWRKRKLQVLECAAVLVIHLIPAYCTCSCGYKRTVTCKDREKLSGLSCHLASFFMLLGFGEGGMGPECPALEDCGFDSIRGVFC